MVKKSNKDKYYSVLMCLREKSSNRKTYSGLFVKQIDVECAKRETEPSSPLIYNRRDVTISQEKKKECCYLDTEHIHNPFYLPMAILKTFFLLLFSK